MKRTELIMGMPITVEVLDNPSEQNLDKVFDYFRYVDCKFSTYKADSEISKINRGELKIDKASKEMQEIFRLAEQTKQESKNYFDIQQPDGSIDPSGIVKGWAIFHASKILTESGHKDYFVDAGGDIQVARPEDQEPWSVGIRNPFDRTKIVKVVKLRSEGMATSGTAVRGQHIYNPHKPDEALSEVVSISVIGPNIYEADRFATAAFAMGREGVYFIERLPGFEAYQIDASGQALQTTNFEKYIQS